MKISYRILLGFILILGIGFFCLIYWSAGDVKVQPKKAMEESMADTAHVLAAYLGLQVEDGDIYTGELEEFIAQTVNRRFSSRIYELEKKKVNVGVYVTDKQGTVIYDSNGGKLEGQDYTRRNDVYLTLKGKYGARTSRLNPDDPLTSIAYVAAPIMSGDEIIGVCTVYKSWASINSFIETTRKKILVAAAVGFAIALVLSFFISRWITSPIRKLTRYAHSVQEGKRTTLPGLGRGEVRELGESFEQMKDWLEGKKYIEKYVQTLTHQLKGPLSAIRGASELLQEEIPESDREKFVSNIETESNRIQRIVDRMLELASIEQQRELRNVENIDLSRMVTDTLEGMTITLEKKQIKTGLKVGDGLTFKGERFLIYQAVFNLLQNAVDFSPAGGFLEVEIQEHWQRLFFIIRDEGPGLPEYALDKVFDKFYSLQRPDTGKKSSGLGLSLVKEVAELHKGEITLKNRKPHGAVAVFKIPMYGVGESK